MEIKISFLSARCSRFENMIFLSFISTQARCLWCYYIPAVCCYFGIGLSSLWSGSYCCLFVIVAVVRWQCAAACCQSVVFRARVSDPKLVLVGQKASASFQELIHYVTTLMGQCREVVITILERLACAWGHDGKHMKARRKWIPPGALEVKWSFKRRGECAFYKDCVTITKRYIYFMSIWSHFLDKWVD